MKFYLNDEEVTVIDTYSLLKNVGCTLVIPDETTPYLYILGSQVRQVIDHIFDIIWQDKICYDDKFWLANLGSRLTREAL